MQSIEGLFKNHALFKILEQLFSTKKQVLFLRELERTTALDINQVQREINRLEKMGLIKTETRGRNKHVFLDPANPFLPVLRAFFEQQQKNLDAYVTLGKEDNMNFLTGLYNIEAFEDPRIVTLGIVKMVPHVFYQIDNNTMSFWTKEKDFVSEGINTRQRLLSGELSLDEVPKIYHAKYDEARTIYSKVKDKTAFTHQEMKQFIAHFRKMMADIGVYAWPALFDLYEQPHTNYVREYLVHKMKDPSVPVAVALERLLAPPLQTVTQQMRIRLLQIAIEAKEDKYSKTSLEKLYDDFRWLNFGWNGPEFEFSFFETSLKELEAKTLSDLKLEQETLNEYESRIKKQKHRLYRQLEIDEPHQRYIESVALLSWLKLFRKDIVFCVNWLTFHILESARKERGITRQELSYLTLDEVDAFVDGTLKISKKEFAARIQHSILDPRGGKTNVYAGEQAKEYRQRFSFKKEEVAGSITLLNGTTACLGPTGDWVYGTVKVIQTAADIAKLEAGDILVSHQTNPDILPAMKKAAAIVTDQGGITCHAAIVSRELNKVCLIGTKYATKVFKDGDKVVVCPRHSYIKFQ